jgi:hypothetical protein
MTFTVVNPATEEPIVELAQAGEAETDEAVAEGGIPRLVGPRTVGLHEDPETFNRATLDFLLRQHS